MCAARRKGHVRRRVEGKDPRRNFDLNGRWSPWYTLHKTFAGLRDAYRHTGNQTIARSLPDPGSYVEITRHWQSGDRVAIALPKTLQLQRVRDQQSKAVVMWGPLVLARDLGAAPRRRKDGDGEGVTAAAPEPVALATDRPVAEWLTHQRQSWVIPGLRNSPHDRDAVAHRRRVLAVLLEASTKLHRVLGCADWRRN